MVKKESEKKLNMRSTRFCNIYEEARLGISLSKYRAWAQNLNMEESTANHIMRAEGPESGAAVPGRVSGSSGSFVAWASLCDAA